MTKSQLIQRGTDWFAEKDFKPFPFQLDAWQAFLDGKSGLLNAPTGSGKTYALFMPIALDFIRQHPKDFQQTDNGLRAIWITPIRALTREIQNACQAAADGLGLNWRVEARTGDTSTSVRQKQKRKPPEVLVTTPESLHLLLATSGYPNYFKNLNAIVIDEWHELMGGKRGVAMELGLSRLKALLPNLKIWGISATIGNLDQAREVLLGTGTQSEQAITIRSGIKKEISVQSMMPEEVERFPWAGHLGITMLEKVVPILHESESTLIFTNTRAQCEIWYQKLLEAAPDLIGLMAMHHSSISRELRDWVEDALHEGKLKVVVCTSSLDLGVDFRPVDTIVQIGSPKGVSRFVQRAGRSGHRPGAASRIYFVPTHSLELIEAAALREAIAQDKMESRTPHIRSFDVLTQYLVTLAISEGFYEEEIYEEIKKTHAFQSISRAEWGWVLDFITTGGALDAYEEYSKIGVAADGLFRPLNKGVVVRHRLSMGTIVSDHNLMVKYLRGKKLGSIEEWFVGQLKPGDVFWFSGRALEFVRIKDDAVLVRKSNAKKGKVPAWMGGRLQLSSYLSAFFRQKVHEAATREIRDEEIEVLQPLFDTQSDRSHLPRANEFLMESFQSKEGYHLVMYPFEGRFVHEGMSALIAYRISQLRPISFSIAMNDYGFELLSDTEIPIEEALEQDLFSTKNLNADIQSSLNSVEIAKRRFRDIASIAGLVFHGYPNQRKRDKHIQSSSNLLFDVFHDYDGENLLYLQAFDEVRTFYLDEQRLRDALNRITSQRLVLTHPNQATPFSFPIIVDRLRERMSSERLEDRIEKMKMQLVRE